MGAFVGLAFLALSGGGGRRFGGGGRRLGGGGGGRRFGGGGGFFLGLGAGAGLCSKGNSKPQLNSRRDDSSTAHDYEARIAQFLYEPDTITAHSSASTTTLPSGNAGALAASWAAYIRGSTSVIAAYSPWLASGFGVGTGAAAGVGPFEPSTDVLTSAALQYGALQVH